MRKIRSITEAYSMQPKTLTVTEKPLSLNRFKSVKEIKQESYNEEVFYTGYNFDGKMIFRYLFNSVNVHYF